MARYNRCAVCGDTFDLSTARLYWLCDSCRRSFERSCEPDLRSIMHWAGRRARRAERLRCRGSSENTPVSDPVTGVDICQADRIGETETAIQPTPETSES